MALAQRCGARNGDLLADIATADTARDLDHLRRLVGDRRLSCLGESYGTLIGQTYANLFPRRVRAMALDGVVDPVAASDQARVLLQEQGVALDCADSPARISPPLARCGASPDGRQPHRRTHPWAGSTPGARHGGWACRPADP